MKPVLIACEESQVVTCAFRDLGVEAYSCDVLATSGEHPEWHFQQDVISVLDFEWSAIIAFPPCTHLASSGARWFDQKRKDGRQQQGINFFMLFAEHPCERIAIENPVGVMSSCWRKPDQIIQPWMFGHGEVKTTCLWLKGLPALKPTREVEGREQKMWRLSPSKDRARLRSKTYPGIAEAMARQWVPILDVT